MDTRVNQSGDIPTFDFTIMNNNPGFDLIKEQKTEVRVYDTDDNILEFAGRVAKRNGSINDNVTEKKYTAEDAVAYFKDTKQKPLTYNGAPSGLLELILERHNSLCLEMDEPHKQFILGKCEVDTYKVFTEKLETVNKELEVNDTATIKQSASTIYADWTMNGLKIADWIKGIALNVEEKKKIGGQLRYKLSRMVNGQKVIEGFVNAEDIEEVNYSEDVKEVEADGIVSELAKGTRVKLSPDATVYFASSNGSGPVEIHESRKDKTYTIDKYIEAFNRYHINENGAPIAWVDEKDLVVLDEVVVKPDGRQPMGTKVKIKSNVTHYYKNSTLSNSGTNRVQIPSKWKNVTYSLGSYSSKYKSYTIMTEGVHRAWISENDLDFLNSPKIHKIQGETKTTKTTVAVEHKRTVEVKEGEIGYETSTFDAVFKYLVEPFGADVTWELDAGVKKINIHNRIWNMTNERISPTLNMLSMQQDFDSTQVITALIPVGQIEVEETVESSSGSSDSDSETTVRKTIGGQITEDAKSATSRFKITVIGDSLGVGTEPYLKSYSWSSANYNNKVSRQWTHSDSSLDAIQQLQNIKNSGSLKDIVVMILGTNRGVNSSEIDRAVSIIGDQRKLILVDTDSQVSHKGAVESAYRSAAQRHANVYHANWRHSSQQSYYGTDKIHMTSTGYQKHAEFIVQAIYDASGRTPSNSISDDKREKAVQRTLANVGGRYVYGGHAFRANDCTGLIIESFRYAGYNIPGRPWTGSILAGEGPFQKIQPHEAQRGDIAITNGGGHAEVLLGPVSAGPPIVHAASEGLGIITQTGHVGRAIAYYRVIDTSAVASGGGHPATSSVFNYYPTVPRESQLNHMYASPYGYASHRGIDIVYTTSNSDIFAVDGGVVTQAQTNCSVGNINCGGGWGNHIIIKHSNGLFTVYAHLESASVSVGSQVSGGQKIGQMGNTGNSTGKHLHLEVLDTDGRTKLNPNNMWDWSSYKSLFKRWW